MSKVTSKFQVSIPRVLASKAGIQIGDELEWEVSSGSLRARPAIRARPGLSRAERLHLFDDATAREKDRSRKQQLPASGERGWTREDLYRR